MFRELLEKLKESRLFLMSGIFFILACVLIHRLFVLQIIRGEEYQENYQLSIVKTKDIPSTRGNTLSEYSGVSPEEITLVATIFPSVSIPIDTIRSGYFPVTDAVNTKPPSALYPAVIAEG